MGYMFIVTVLLFMHFIICFSFATEVTVSKVNVALVFFVLVGYFVSQ
jgi:hypothetical protein